jgi:hypothetical protein
MASVLIDLEAHLAEVRASLKLIAGAPEVVIRATLPANAAYPQDAEHIILDLIPTAPTVDFDGGILEDLALQVGAWSATSLTKALAIAELARARMNTLGYARTGGAQFLTEEQYHGVLCTYTLVAAFDSLT